MNNFRRLSIVAAFIVALSPLGVAAPASAAVSVSVAKTTQLVNGDQVGIILANVPATQGVYIQQCYQPRVGQRAATGLRCNGSLQQTDVMIWATMDGARGSQSAAAPLVFTLRDSVTTFEADGRTVKERLACGADNCALFVYRDHRGLQDTTLDTIVPLSFLAEQTVRLGAVGLPKADSTQRVGTRLTLRASALQTREKSAIRVSSATPKTCTVSSSGASTTVRFVARGECRVKLVAKPTRTHLRLNTQITYQVG
jgi:hypothetical protein